jgi:hypothetical protein
MPKKKKSDDKEETINTPESVAVNCWQFQHRNFVALKNKLQIHGLPVGLWNKGMNYVKKKVWLCTKTEKLVVVPAVKFELLEWRQKMDTKISKEWANNEITHFGITREQ